MKFFNLDPEEKKILKSYEKGQLKPVAKIQAEKRRIEQIAHFSLKKTKNINIRLSQKDLLKLKAKAASEGIPYQTMISSILHRFSCN